MTQTAMRQVVAQMVIIVGICMGAWIIVVQPQSAKLRRLQGEIRQTSMVANRPTQAQLDETKAALDVRLKALQQRNDLSSDSSALYARVMSLARECDIVVQTVRPGGKERSGSTKAQYSTAKIDIIVDGTFERVAAFVSAIERIPAFLRPVEMSISPTERAGQGSVTVRIVFEALSFNVPESLEKLMETNHAQQ